MIPRRNARFKYEVDIMAISREIIFYSRHRLFPVKTIIPGKTVELYCASQKRVTNNTSVYPSDVDSTIDFLFSL